ncbi:cytosine-specific methyltransferase [Richelia sinica FACHB-800]|uniref:Cytosine-specific methyltransferase n=1 Tax=Richelia sinica FACHB-800 TaxID=1357546 RepID=A0A975TC11_9NOST|nr:DNA cytosine methyltransferase [Richelia sinica]MBD2666658.1 DNA cytosine methyltransferase [Richelia sinica FACHB-800]QXE25277.1 cytosine-specific methyltransferase [Richelia sinica FACHB-800]
MAKSIFNEINKSSLKVLDIFAGCGGLSLGFQNAGFEIVAAFDNWKAAINVYQKNFNHPMINCDLSQVNGDYTLLSQIPEIDVIIGGPPCQDFSSAGNRNEDLGRGSLSIVFAEIVRVISPQWFVMENVDRFPKSRKYLECRKILKSANYGLTEKILDASLCGVPQKRKRFFCIGELGGKDEGLLFYLESNLSKKSLTIREYTGDILGIEYYYRHPRSYKRRAIFSIDEPSPTIRGVNRPIPKNYQLHSGDACPVTSSLRPLTTIERSYIQTFPYDFIFEGSKTDLEQMIGNAVPVKLAEYVAKALLKYIHHKYKDEFFSKSLSLPL